MGWLSGWLGAEGSGGGGGSEEPAPTPIPATDFAVDDPELIDHVTESLDRLCEQFKSDDEDDEE